MNRLFTNTLRPRSSNYTITSGYVLCHKFSRSRKKKVGRGCWTYFRTGALLSFQSKAHKLLEKDTSQILKYE